MSTVYSRHFRRSVRRFSPVLIEVEEEERPPADCVGGMWIEAEEDEEEE